MLGCGLVLLRDYLDNTIKEQEDIGPALIELSAELVATGWGAAQHLGLSWTGMDFMRESETGDHYILECNAAAMFVGFSRMTGCDVPGAIADLLIKLARLG